MRILRIKTVQGLLLETPRPNYMVFDVSEGSHQPGSMEVHDPFITDEGVAGFAYKLDLAAVATIVVRREGNTLVIIINGVDSAYEKIVLETEYLEIWITEAAKPSEKALVHALSKIVDTTFFLSFIAGEYNYPELGEKETEFCTVEITSD